MTKNIVICSDGTGNTFSRHVSNITHLIKLLELGEPAKQCVFYDQGLGTNPSLVAEVDSYRNEQMDNRRGLTILPKPGDDLLFSGFFGRLAALAFGYGLRQNVKEMYQALMKVYDEGDQVFLLGFSRGAFTVRVLAGIIYRCGLLPEGTLSFEQRFREAYELYKPHHLNQACVEHFKAANHVRACEIHFLGLWDTVKSYGGIWPKSLPHLRYNPIVKTVRHALALDEHRSWFIPTSWGGIDSDDPDAQGVEPDRRYASQNVEEVWFRGCHSDVGGGDEEVKTARTPLRWMISEAVARGLIVNSEGRALLAEGNASGIPVIHESLNRRWLVSEYLPRWELDNGTRPPKRFFKCGRSGKRDPLQFKRAGKVLLHASTREANPLGIAYVSTIAFSIRHEFPSEWARFKEIHLSPRITVSLSIKLKDKHFPDCMQGTSLSGRATQFHIFARAKTQPVSVELLREGRLVGKKENFEGGMATIVPAAPLGHFELSGSFELRFDTTSFEDLWMVIDWSPPPDA